MRTIHRYITREIAVPFLLGLAAFTGILLIARILKLVELVVNRGVPALQVLKLFSYIMPAFLEVTVPMALLLGVLIAFGRLSSDSEMVALHSSGVSLYQLLVPVAMFAVAIYCVTLGLSIYARPWGNRMLRDGLYELAKVRASAGIREQVFNDDFAGLVIYVEEIEPPGTTLKRIVISDTRDPNQHNTVFAKLGIVVNNEAKQTLTLRLLDGSIHSFDPGGRSYNKTDFSIYDISLDLDTALARAQHRERDANELTLTELHQAIADKAEAGQSSLAEQVELQRKFSIPFACLVFAALAVPLGVQPTRSVRSRGFSTSLVLILAYYLLLSLGESLGERGTLQPIVALWIPNVVLASLAIALLLRAGRQSSLASVAAFDRWLASWRARWESRLDRHAES
ncbi:MAG TPA: LPS export ABC transporter permease LptF [Candidatus Kryptonia bacterium]|nr:LPS export ABC transporter permease LptF [Candidatus Kryptonia bacterium]